MVLLGARYPWRLQLFDLGKERGWSFRGMVSRSQYFSEKVTLPRKLMQVVCDMSLPFAEICSGSEDGSYSRLIDFCATEL